ncbi:alpha-1,3-rhamnosyltransferase [Xylanibacter ruminicola]|uniref:Alpha-1,3-rhamnosyltransferase n=1 Tax=Xylanibacter ruminicola TaxID=839 RepID=A0A1H4DKJ4_XYLRU|nr:glycosyltransferase [Xylanibacter ruminicola]SEA73058.1 alpha-1,3-rhamnosyltransferase [Xylanibacter ruminicola]
MSNQEIKKPLVTVCIVTYNSSEFIVEALDSVFEQTYQNIELIVSDDCSKDNTVEVCKKWMSEHANRFAHAEVVTSSNNTGVSANSNRGIRKGTGEYIKLLAGDDKLLPNCLEDNVNYMLEHKNTDLLFSDMKVFGQGQDGTNIISPAVFFHYFTKKQFKLWNLVYSGLPAPACFMRREVYNRLGGYDETIAFMEDKPFWVKAIWAGCSLQYTNVTTVQYRVNPNALSQTRKSSNYHKMTESRIIASKYFLSQMRDISWMLWLYGKSRYDKEFYPSIKTYALYSLRFTNPYYYYLKYLLYKQIFFQKFK